MKERTRNLIQCVTALVQNAHLSGFVTGKISQGVGKSVCVPGLNCYSCPGALGACPIGSLQAIIGSRSRTIPYYVLGTILLFGVLFGRLICGLFCPFGFVQDLLHKIRLPKRKLPQRLDRTLRWGKFVSLAAVLFLPVLITDPFGLGTPAFCKYLCPAGTLEGGIPLLLHNEPLRATVGFLFSWKAAVLAVVIIGSVLIYRPFCRYLCPLGGIYGLLNRFSLYQMQVDTEKCTGCKACERACPMEVRVTEHINSVECIRCGHCKTACSVGAIQSGFRVKAQTSKSTEP